jgi:hypothetical protein
MSGYKYVPIGEHKVKVGSEEHDLIWFIRWLLENDHVRFNMDLGGARIGMRIESALEPDEHVNGSIKLTVEDHQKLSQAASGPVLRTFDGSMIQGYPTGRARDWVPLAEAITNLATDKPPAAPAKKGKTAA